MPQNVASILRTFDGQTKTYFPSTPEDCTELLKAELQRDAPGLQPERVRAQRSGGDDAAGGDDTAVPGWIPLSVDSDSTGALYIQRLALAEMGVTKDDGQQTARIGRVALTPSGEELHWWAKRSTRTRLLPAATYRL
jgi:hypothetical protein